MGLLCAVSRQSLPLNQVHNLRVIFIHFLDLFYPRHMCDVQCKLINSFAFLYLRTTDHYDSCDSTLRSHFTSQIKQVLSGDNSHFPMITGLNLQPDLTQQQLVQFFIKVMFESYNSVPEY